MSTTATASPPTDAPPLPHFAARRGTDDPPSPFARLAALLLERKWVVIGAVLLAVGLTGLVLVWVPERYIARSTVVVGARTPQVVALTPVMNPLEISPFATQTQVETEIQIARSRGLAERLMIQLGLHQDPEFNPVLAARQPLALPQWLPAEAGQAIEALRGWLQPPPAGITEEVELSLVLEDIRRHTEVEAVGRSTALAISASSTDPEKAARIANVLAELYVGASQEDKVAATERAMAALRDRLDELQRGAVAADRAVERYRIEAGLLDRDEAGGTAQQIAEIRSQIIGAQGAIATASARLARLQEAGGDIAASADVLGSPVVQRLREQEVLLDRDVRDLATRLGTRHPDSIGRRAALEAVRLRLREEINRIAASLESELEVAQDRERRLREDLARAEREVGARNEAAVRLRELRREAEASRRLYEVFLQRYQEVVQQRGLQQPDAQIVSRARPPQLPSWPPKPLFLGLAGIGAAVLASLLVVLRELRRGSLRGPEGVRDALQMPTLAAVPRIGAAARLRGPRAATIEQGNPAFGESIQRIRMQIGRLALRRSGRIVLITSAVGGEGKTSVATACARLAARAGESVIVIDCDMRRPRIEAVFGRARHGLADLLAGRCSLEEAIATDAASGVAFIAAHPRPGSSPIDLLGSEAMEVLLRRLVGSFDLVLLDSPPVLAVADALAVAPCADATLLIADAERTPRHTVRAALDLLLQAGVEVSGIVLSKVRARHGDLHGYGYVHEAGALQRAWRTGG